MSTLATINDLLCQIPNCPGCSDVLSDCIKQLQLSVNPLLSLIDVQYTQYKSAIITQLLNEGSLGNIPDLKPSQELTDKFIEAKIDMTDAREQAEIVKHLQKNPGSEQGSVILQKLAKLKEDLSRLT